jgi:hypothetical protein
LLLEAHGRRAKEVELIQELAEVVASFESFFVRRGKRKENIQHKVRPELPSIVFA